MYNISIIGCGKWSNTIINEIQNHDKFDLRAIVCKSKLNNLSNIKTYTKLDDLFRQEDNTCIFVAAIPHINLEVVKLAETKKIPLILEKPISNSYADSLKIRDITMKNKIIVIPNISNYFSETFIILKEFILNNINEIKSISVIEGSDGPIREKIHPIWDWGFHAFTMLNLFFENENFDNLQFKEVIKNKSENRFVTKFYFKYNKKFKVKILTGNYFKKKIRKIKIELNGQESLIGDFINHELYFKNKPFFKSKLTPINVLLNNFYKSIKFKDVTLSKRLINASCKTAKILEKFYNC